MTFRQELFWDVDPAKIDEETNARFIIERVMTRGKMSDFAQLQKTYSLDRIKRELVRCRSLDPKTLNFCSVIYGIEKEDFRCFSKTPSSQKLWNC